MAKVNPNYPSLDLSPAELAWLVLGAGFRADNAVVAVGISDSESSGVTNAWRPASQNPDGGNDRGLVQWNSKWHPDISDAQAMNPYSAFQLMFTKSNRGTNFGHWSPDGPSSPSADGSARARVSGGTRSAAAAGVAAPKSCRARLAAVGWHAPPGWPDVPGSTAAGADGGLPPELQQYDTNGDGKLTFEGDMSAAEKDAYLAAIEKLKAAGLLETATSGAAAGQYNVNDLATVVPPLTVGTAGLTAAELAALQKGAAVQLGGLSLIEQGPVSEFLDDVIPDLGPWAEGLGKLIAILLDPTWWRRIGIALAGALLIAGVLFFTVRSQILP